jgi:ribose-phosphate pyrophosphokinase
MATDERLKVFTGSASRQFTSKVCSHLRAAPGDSEVLVFSDGNTFVRVRETVRDKDIFLIQTIGLRPNDEFMEFLFWVDAFKRASARSVTAVIPYFGYAKGDKKDEPRVSIRARVCADCAESAGIDRVLTMDLHSPQIQGFFKKPVDHLQAFPILCECVKAWKLDDLAVASPDAGFAKTARKYASCLRAPLIIGDKVRTGHDERAEVLEIVGNPKGRDVVIVDDFTVSCGTLVDMAEALKEHGARRIMACVTHGLLRDDGLARLTNSPIERLAVTDTVHNESLFAHPKVTVVSVAPMFAEAIRIISRHESLSELFASLTRNAAATRCACDEGSAPKLPQTGPRTTRDD